MAFKALAGTKVGISSRGIGGPHCKNVKECPQFIKKLYAENLNYWKYFHIAPLISR